MVAERRVFTLMVAGNPETVTGVHSFPFVDGEVEALIISPDL